MMTISQEHQSAQNPLRDDPAASNGRERIISIHSHSHPLRLSFTSRETAKDCRAMAEGCAKSAHEARDDDVSAPLLQLGQIWLDAASKLDGLPAGQVPPTPERLKVVKWVPRC